MTIDPEALTELLCDSIETVGDNAFCESLTVDTDQRTATIRIKIVVPLHHHFTGSCSREMKPRNNDSVPSFVFDTRERAISLLRDGAISDSEEITLMKVIRALRG